MSEWDEYADGWDDDPAVQAYAQAAFESLARVVDHAALKGCRVLDFGCGTGQLTGRLAEAGASVVAVDTSTAMVGVLETKSDHNGWNDVTVSTELPDTSTRFDLIVCSSVLGFVDDYPATVADLASRLRDGGHLVQWDWERADDGDDHGLGRDEIRAALSSAGLVDIAVGSGFEIPFEDQTMSPLMGSARRPDAPAPKLAG